MSLRTDSWSTSTVIIQGRRRISHMKRKYLIGRASEGTSPLKSNEKMSTTCPLSKYPGRRLTTTTTNVVLEEIGLWNFSPLNMKQQGSKGTKVWSHILWLISLPYIYTVKLDNQKNNTFQLMYFLTLCFPLIYDEDLVLLGKMRG